MYCVGEQCMERGDQYHAVYGREENETIYTTERVNSVLSWCTVYGKGDQYHAVYGLEEAGAKYSTLLRG